MVDRWNSQPISCVGGLVLDTDTLLQGTQFPGTARQLQNFEPDIAGGYRRVSGFTKYDSNIVADASSNPILGLKVAMGGVFACRKIAAGTDNRIYYSTGAGWTRVTTTARPGAVTKARFTSYSLSAPVVIQCDGVNPAWKWSGGVETTINGVGAPTNPKYARLFKGRLALAGYGTGDKLSLSAANADTDFTGASGAIEFNVGDTIKGLAVFRGTLVIFCERSIKRLTGSTSADFAIESVTEFIGCVSEDTIQEVGGDLQFLATDGVRSYEATTRIGDIELGLISKAIQPLISNVLSIGYTEDEFSSCAIRKKSQYRLFINNSSVGDTDNTNFLGRLTDTPVTSHGQFEWALLVGFKAYSADSQYTSNTEIAIFGHTTNGYVYRMESGNTWDGTNIEALYRTPDLTLSDSTLRKVFHKIHMFTLVEGDINMDISLLLDREDVNIIQPSAINVGQTGGTSTYGSAIYDTDVYGVFIYPNFKKNLIGLGYFGAFLFYCNNDSAPFRIDSFVISFALKGRR